MTRMIPGTSSVHMDLLIVVAALGIALVGGDLSSTQYDYKNTVPCEETHKVCEFWLVIEEKLTMEYQGNLLIPKEGKLYAFYDTSFIAPVTVEPNGFVQGDGFWQQNRMVTVVNSSYPGPTLNVWEGQELIVHVRNDMRQEGTTIHWHGLHQRNTQFADGVPYVSQWPIHPGQTYTYRFTATPAGTFWYHSHVGSQRTNGIFGPLIIHPKNKLTTAPEEFVMVLNDWNHDYDSTTGYNKIEDGTYEDGVKYTGTFGIDGSYYSLLQFHSGLINGKGRFYTSETKHNEAPLSQFDVTPGKVYKFRTLSAGAMYPFRISIDQHKLTVIASDGYDIVPYIVDELVINPGERYDFTITADRTPGNFWIIAETTEKDLNTPHIAEAVLHYVSKGIAEPAATKFSFPRNPNSCTVANECTVLNCPFKYFPSDQNRKCIQLEELESADNQPAPTEQFEEEFLNFAYPEDPVTTDAPGSVNGRQFHLPANKLLYDQRDEEQGDCGSQQCGVNSVCQCTNMLQLLFNRTYQLVFTNVGDGSQWSHPIHMHGHTFYVIKQGFGEYNDTTGLLKNGLGATNADVECLGTQGFCNGEEWANSSWKGGNVPGQNLKNPIRKDTIMVPSQGYVVVRIRSDNPGLWIMHCHIGDHNIDGMAMMINEAPDMQPSPPVAAPAPSCPTCSTQCPTQGPGSTQSGYEAKDVPTDSWKTITVALSIALGCVSAILVVSLAVSCCVLGRKRPPSKVV